MIKNIENGFNRIAQVLWGLWIIGILITSKNVVNKCIFDGYIFTHFKICYGQLESWLLLILFPLIPYWIVVFVWRGFINKKY